jgi:hypothetical protein
MNDIIVDIIKCPRCGISNLECEIKCNITNQVSSIITKPETRIAGIRKGIIYGYFICIGCGTVNVASYSCDKNMLQSIGDVYEENELLYRHKDLDNLYVDEVCQKLSWYQ